MKKFGKRGKIMLKGVQKNVMRIKFPRGRYFEEAYFVVRRCEGEQRDNGGMVREANRIIGEMKPCSKKQARGRPSAFFIGMTVGALLVSIIWLLTLLAL